MIRFTDRRAINRRERRDGSGSELKLNSSGFRFRKSRIKFNKSSSFFFIFYLVQDDVIRRDGG